MSKTPMTPALHIARKHQSSPKEHWIDKELKTAAEEIDSGNFVPELHKDDGQDFLEHLPLALRHGKPGWDANAKPSIEDIQETRDLMKLGNHPRVLEALERLKQESSDAKSSEEMTEMLFAMHELQELRSRANQWEGQERWQGSDAEESRMGKLLTPIQFHAQLCNVIGKDRVILGEGAVKMRPEDESARVGLFVRNPEWTGGAANVVEFGAVRAQHLRTEGEKEMARARQYKAAGMLSAAHKAMQKAGDLAMEAMKILSEGETLADDRPKEFIRVATLQWPLGTEWMVMRFDRYGVPTTAKYLGWRTALLAMVRSRVISEKEAHEAFPVTMVCESAATWYRQQLYALRNAKVM